MNTRPRLALLFLSLVLLLCSCGDTEAPNDPAVPPSGNVRESTSVPVPVYTDAVLMERTLLLNPFGGSRETVYSCSSANADWKASPLFTFASEPYWSGAQRAYFYYDDQALWRYDPQKNDAQRLCELSFPFGQISYVGPRYALLRDRQLTHYILDLESGDTTTTRLPPFPISVLDGHGERFLYYEHELMCLCCFDMAENKRTPCLSQEESSPEMLAVFWGDKICLTDADGKVYTIPAADEIAPREAFELSSEGPVRGMEECGGMLYFVQALEENTLLHFSSLRHDGTTTELGQWQASCISPSACILTVSETNFSCVLRTQEEFYLGDIPE